MGKFNGGLLRLVTGKIGTMVSYTTKVGYSVVRTIGVRTAPFTPAELKNQAKTGVITIFLKPILPVIRIGFQNPPEGKNWTAYNHASSVLKLNSTIEIDGNQQVDFKKVVISVGNIPSPKNVTTVMQENQIKFSWDPDLHALGADKNDRVMVLAYFPESLKSIYILSGANRKEGAEYIPLPEFSSPTIVETYIAFVQSDGKMVSGSKYAGQLITQSTL